MGYAQPSLAVANVFKKMREQTGGCCNGTSRLFSELSQDAFDSHLLDVVLKGDGV